MRVTRNGNELAVNGHVAPADKIKLLGIDYGDNYYDLQFVYKDNSDLFGNAAICAIKGKEKLEKLANEYAEKSGCTYTMEFEADI